MNPTPLSAVQWHDLPVDELTIRENGLRLVVSPFDEATQEYVSGTLSLFDADAFGLDITGSISSQDLQNLEISSFSWSGGEKNRLSGTIDLLPGSAGVWRVTFSNAAWDFALKV